MNTCWTSPLRYDKSQTEEKQDVCYPRRELEANPQVRQSSLEREDLGQILQRGSNYKNEEWEEELYRQHEKWMQITLLMSDDDAFPSKPCAFSDVTQALPISSPVRAGLHLDSPSWAMAPCMTIRSGQKVGS